MKSANGIDEQIDAALRIMRNAAPPDGMQIRLLRSALRAQEQQTGPLLTPLRLVAAVACCVIAISGIAVSKRNAAVEREKSVRVAVSDSAGPVFPIPGPQKATPHISPPESRLLSAKTHDASMLARVERSAVTGPAGSRAAYAEMLAPSQPAPELPLTQQERLLLLAAKRQDSTSQVAELRRPVWPLRDPADDEDFQKYFEKPPAPHQPGDPE